MTFLCVHLLIGVALVDAQLTSSLWWPQDELAEAQHAAQQLLPDNHAVLQQGRSLRQRQVQLQSSVDSLRAAKQSAEIESIMLRKSCSHLFA